MLAWSGARSRCAALAVALSAGFAAGAAPEGVPPLAAETPATLPSPSPPDAAAIRQASTPKLVPPPPRPAPVRYAETPDLGAPLPPGAQRVKRARMGLVVPGAVLFGTVWATSWALTAFSVIAPFTGPPAAPGAPTGVPLEEFPYFAATSVAASVPVAGLFFLGVVANTPPWKTYTRLPPVAYFVAAGMQATGLVLLAAAALWPERLVRAPVKPAAAPLALALDWSLTPGAGDAPAGVSFVLRFP